MVLQYFIIFCTSEVFKDVVTKHFCWNVIISSTLGSNSLNTGLVNSNELFLLCCEWIACKEIHTNIVDILLKQIKMLSYEMSISKY